MFFALVWIGFAVVTALAAKARQRGAFVWFLLGLAFGVFALIAVLVMGTPEPQEVAKTEADLEIERMRRVASEREARMREMDKPRR